MCVSKVCTITVQEGYLGTPLSLRILYAFVQGLEMPHVGTCLEGMYHGLLWVLRVPCVY